MTEDSDVTDLWADSRCTTLRLAAYDGEAGSPTVVVLHGLGAGIDVLRDVMPDTDPFTRLRALGTNVLALDWPGHGRSGGRRGRLGYRQAMDAAATAVDLAGQRWAGAPVVLLGLGIGGTLACYAALEDDRVAAVVSHGLIDLRDIRPVLRRARQQIALPVAGWLARRLPPAWLRRIRVPVEVLVARSDRAFDPRLAARLRTHPLAVHAYDLDALASLLLSPEDKPSLAALTTPTLVVVGSHDAVLPPTAAHAAAGRMAGLHETWVLPGAGHELLLEHGEALLERIDQHLDTTVRRTT